MELKYKNMETSQLLDIYNKLVDVESIKVLEEVYKRFPFEVFEEQYSRQEDDIKDIRVEIKRLQEQMKIIQSIDRLAKVIEKKLKKSK